MVILNLSKFIEMFSKSLLITILTCFTHKRRIFINIVLLTECIYCACNQENLGCQTKCKLYLGYYLFKLYT